MRVFKTNEMTREEVLQALREPPPGGYYVWDGVDEDDRPATEEELQAALAAAAQKRRGRPAGSGTKEQVALRVDREVLAAFRATGPGWQTRMNDVLREWVKAHPAG
jgi:uncharacterized protein (DUF4415 family)